MNEVDVSVERAQLTDRFATTATGRELTLEELNHWLSYVVRRVDRDITRYFLERFGYDQTVPPVALSVLMLISTTPGLDQHEIAVELGLDKANTARLLRQLDRSGWLLRRHPSHDRRKKGVFLTPQGVHELAKLKRNMRRFENDLANVFSETEFDTLLRLLNKLHAHAGGL